MTYQRNYRKPFIAITCVCGWWMFSTVQLLYGKGSVAEVGRRAITIAEASVRNGTLQEFCVVLITGCILLVFPACVLGWSCYLIGRQRSGGSNSSGSTAQAKPKESQSPLPRFGSDSFLGMQEKRR